MILLLQIEHAGRFVKRGDALEMFPSRDVDHFKSVVAERGDKEPAPPQVERKMIEAAFDPRQWNSLDELERDSFLGGKAEHSGQAHDHHDPHDLRTNSPSERHCRSSVSWLAARASGP